MKDKTEWGLFSCSEQVFIFIAAFHYNFVQFYKFILMLPYTIIFNVIVDLFKIQLNSVSLLLLSQFLMKMFKCVPYLKMIGSSSRSSPNFLLVPLAYKGVNSGKMTSAASVDPPTPSPFYLNPRPHLQGESFDCQPSIERACLSGNTTSLQR